MVSGMWTGKTLSPQISRAFSTTPGACVVVRLYIVGKIPRIFNALLCFSQTISLMKRSKSCTPSRAGRSAGSGIMTSSAAESALMDDHGGLGDDVRRAYFGDDKPNGHAAIIPISIGKPVKGGRRWRPRASFPTPAGAKNSNGRSIWACPAPNA